MCPTSGVMSTETPPSVARKKKRGEGDHVEVEVLTKPKALAITQGFIEQKAKEVADSVKRNAARGFASGETSGRFVEVELTPGSRRVVDTGKFNPAQPAQTKPKQGFMFEGYPEVDSAKLTGKLRGADATYRGGRLTGYFAPRQDEYSNYAAFKKEVNTEGVGIRSDGKYLYYTGKIVDGIITSSGAYATPEHTFAAKNPAWRGKYAVVVRDGQVLGYGKVEDTGGKLKQNQLDYFVGTGKTAQKRCYELTGKADFYFYDSEEDMMRALNEAGITFR